MNLKPIRLQIALHTLSLHRKSTRCGNTEPYLWNIFFRVDGDAITINPDFTISGKAVFHFSKGSHRNLRRSIHRDKTIHIPTDIGVWQTDLKPISLPYFEQDIPGIAGVICVLLEENNVSNDGAEAGRIALGQQVQNALNTALHDFEPKVIDITNIQNSIQDYFHSKVGEFAEGIERHVVEAIKTRQSLLRNVWSLIKADALIGFHVWNFNPHQLSTEGTLNFNHKWNTKKYGDWEILGKTEILEHV